MNYIYVKLKRLELFFFNIYLVICMNIIGCKRILVIFISVNI